MAHVLGPLPSCGTNSLATSKNAVLALARGGTQGVAEQRRSLKTLREHMNDSGGLKLADRTVLKRLSESAAATP